MQYLSHSNEDDQILISRVELSEVAMIKQRHFKNKAIYEAAIAFLNNNGNFLARAKSHFLLSA